MIAYSWMLLEAMSMVPGFPGRISLISRNSMSKSSLLELPVSMAGVLTKVNRTLLGRVFLPCLKVLYHLVKMFAWVRCAS